MYRQYLPIYMDSADWKYRLGADVKPFNVPTAAGKKLCGVTFWKTVCINQQKGAPKTHGYQGYVPSLLDSDGEAVAVPASSPAECEVGRLYSTLGSGQTT